MGDVAEKPMVYFVLILDAKVEVLSGDKQGCEELGFIGREGANEMFESQQTAFNPLN